MLNGIKQFYQGRSPALIYTVIGFCGALFLGYLTLSVASVASELGYRVGFIKLDLMVIGCSIIGGLMSLAFLVFISLAVWRYFILHTSIKANVLLVLGILHIPVSLLTILVFATSFLDGLSALIRDFP